MSCACWRWLLATECFICFASQSKLLKLDRENGRRCLLEQSRFFELPWIRNGWDLLIIYIWDRKSDNIVNGHFSSFFIHILLRLLYNICVLIFIMKLSMFCFRVMANSRLFIFFSQAHQEEAWSKKKKREAKKKDAGVRKRGGILGKVGKKNLVYCLFVFEKQANPFNRLSFDQ